MDEVDKNSHPSTGRKKITLCLSMTISISDNDDAVDHVVKVIVAIAQEGRGEGAQ